MLSIHCDLQVYQRLEKDGFPGTEITGSSELGTDLGSSQGTSALKRGAISPAPEKGFKLKHSV